ncbi:excalibur calcium-binding domain-containing protein [Schaalia sp. 19OD2882]|uniref:excalibur calcium-binding domain-containing protein n=1 Tax=Schaalia sp. 19OD2882 TaxID=2794089 RepID=UPI001C1ECF82|nr:excalibur calcium-binding domain-containing protein [Schaalia sp. 19OD2882]QWW20567.1 excalibur calcium-binding domain-containing protein [Schaalia sp. 19OD2882]
MQSTKDADKRAEEERLRKEAEEKARLAAKEAEAQKKAEEEAARRQAEEQARIAEEQAAAERAAAEEAARQQAEEARDQEVNNFVSTPQPSERVYYHSCKDARNAGAAPLYRGDPGYRDKLDRDQDGIACE